MIKVIYVLCSILLFACSEERNSSPYNLFGNSSRTSSYEKLGRFWTGIASLEKAPCSDTSGFISFPLALSDNKFVTSTSNGVVVCFKHSNLLWEYYLPANEYLVSSICASPSEELIFITNQKIIYSLDNNGKLRWKIVLDDSSTFFTHLLATKTGVYFVSQNKILYKLSYAGKILWQMQLPISSTNYFAAGGEDKLIINLTNDKLGETDTVILIDGNGSIIWKRYFPGLRLVRSPIAWNDKIFVYGYYEEKREVIGKLISLDYNGRNLWSKEFGIIPRFLSISNNGELFLILYNTGLGENVSTIYKLDISGNIISRQHISSTFYTPLFISKEILGAVGYTRGNPVMLFFDLDLNLWKSIDLSKYPSILNIPAFLEDCTLYFVAASKNFLVRIDENPIIKLLPW
ncbi:MAG: hypothetical protein ACK4SO_00635 [Candidatus Kapaibacteriota bacterium]